MDGGAVMLRSLHMRVRCCVLHPELHSAYGALSAIALISTKIINEPGLVPNGVSLEVRRDIPPGGQLVVAWRDEFRGVLQSNAICMYVYAE